MAVNHIKSIISICVGCVEFAIFPNTTYEKIAIFLKQLLYDPINPDVSTKAVQIFQKRELLDREFWFLQIFSSHLINAGFQELEAKYLRKSFVMKPVGQGVLVSSEIQYFHLFIYVRVPLKYMCYNFVQHFKLPSL